MNCIVMEISGARAVLLGNNGTFITARNKNYHVGQKIRYYPAVQARSVASLAACFLALFIGIGGCKLYFTPVAYMSIDINPSIQLSLNILNRVIGASALNEDGEKILGAVSVKNDTVVNSVREIIGCAENKGYLSGSDKSVIVDVLDEKNNVIGTISGLSEEYTGIDLIIESADMADKNLSDKMGISIGRAHSLIAYSKATGAPIDKISDDIKYADVMVIKEKSSRAVNMNDPAIQTKTSASSESPVYKDDEITNVSQPVVSKNNTTIPLSSAVSGNEYKETEIILKKNPETEENIDFIEKAANTTNIEKKQSNIDVTDIQNFSHSPATETTQNTHLPALTATEHKEVGSIETDKREAESPKVTPEAEAHTEQNQ